MRKFTAFLLALVLLLSLAAPVFGAGGTKSDDIVILYTNDVHTYIDGALSYDVIAGVKTYLQTQYENVLLVDAGDHAQGTAFGSMDKGKTIIELMNAAGYDAATLGNHEFDYGMDGRINITDNWASFPYLSCNFYNETAGVRGANVLDAYKIFDLGAEKVAVIGITTPESFTKSTPAYFQDGNGEYIYGISGGEDGRALYADVQAAVDAAEAEGATKIIALGHLGDDLASRPWTSEETIANVEGLDAFIDGHSHSTVEGKEVNDKNGDKVLLTQTGEYFNAIGMMVIDADTGAITTELLDATNAIVTASTPDAAVTTIKADWISDVEDALGVKIGQADITLDNYDANGKRLVRLRQTNTGSFAADALYYLFDNMGMDVDVAIMNGGGVRNRAVTGELTYLSMKQIHTFGNVACLQTVTGQQLLDALEWGARGTYAEEIGGFLHVAGLRYRVNAKIASTVQMDQHGVWAGGPTDQYRVYDVQIFDKDINDYVPLDLGASYNLAGYNYTLRDLGDGFAMFDGAVNVLDYVMEDYMVLANYVQAFPNATVDANNSPLSEKYSGMWIDYKDVYGDGRIEVELPSVGSVGLSGVSEVKVGDAIVLPTIPNGTDFTIEDIRLLEHDGNSWTDTTDAKYESHIYSLEVTVKAATGLSFKYTDFYFENCPYSVGWTTLSDDTAVVYMDIVPTPEKGFVEEIVLEAPESITAGAAATAPTIKVNEGAVTVSKVQWYDDYGSPFTGNFEAGKVYHLQIVVKANEGYGLRDGHYTEAVQGEKSQWPYLHLDVDGAGIIDLRYSLRSVIEKVEVTVTSPANGAAVSEPTVPQDAKYAINHYQWTVYDPENGSFELATTFQTGKKYFLDMEFWVADGYEFMDQSELVVTINGEKPNEYSFGTDGGYIYHQFSMMKTIDRVDITMPAPALGQTPDMDKIKVPEGAKYTVEHAQWYGSQGALSGAFGKDRYNLNLTLRTQNGYDFSKDLEVYINGEKIDDFGTHEWETMLDMGYEVSFRDVISKIEIPKLPIVAVGDQATAPQLTAPAGANYQLMAWWMKCNGLMSLEDFSGAFADKSVYYLMIQVEPNAGYEFAEDAKIFIGDKEMTAGIKMVGTEYVVVMKMYSFGLTIVDKLDLTIDAPENGKKPGKFTVPEDAIYTVEDYSWSVSKDEDADESETMEKKDVFAYGNYYWVAASIQLKEGYVLAEDAEVTVNGKPIDTELLVDVFGFVPMMGDAAIFYSNFGQLTEPADIPATGDMSVILWAVAGISSMLGLGVAALKKRG